MSFSLSQKKAALILGVVVAFLTAFFVYYSQTASFAWDEGFHILAAQLIAHGKRPYLDFFFPQTPLNTYWNAMWMRWFGDSWKVVHAVAAVETAAAVLLVAHYLNSRFPVVRWRFAAALTGTLLFGLNLLIVQFGSLAQAYSMCLLFLVSAFCVGVVAVERRSLLWSFAAGCLVSGAAASSLLTILAIPVLLLWILLYNREGKRLSKLAGYLVGIVVPFTPVLLLYVQAPKQVFFNVLQFNYRYRAIGWKEVGFHDLDVLTSWVDSSHALLLITLSIFGVLAVRRPEWPSKLRAEFYLCAWLSVIIGVHIATPHPTFERYYLLIVPFLSILSTAGLYGLTERLKPNARPLVPVLLVLLLLFGGLGRTFLHERTAYKWSDLEKLAKQVDKVTPPGAMLWADECIYFLTRRTPPTGMEHENSRKPLPLPSEFLASLHIVPNTVMEKRIQAGVFSTIATCQDDEVVERIGIPKLYAQKVEVAGCTVYWDRVPASPKKATP